MRLCRSPCRSSIFLFYRFSHRCAAVLRCLQFGRSQLADDWALSELQSWPPDRKSTRLNSSHDQISYAVFCLKKKKKLFKHNSMQKEKKNNKTKQTKNNR